MAFIFLLFLFCLCSQINLALKLISSSSDFVTDWKLVLLVPLIYTIILSAFLVYWLFTFLLVYSVGDVEYNQNFYLGKINYNSKTKLYIWIMVLSFCWFIALTLSANIFTISSLSASWYFDPRRNGVSIPRAFLWTYTYHLGSIAFGSLIIALIWMI